MNSVRGAAARVLKEVQRDLPADMIAEIILDRGWCTSRAASPKEQIQSIGSSLQRWYTQIQPNRPGSDHIFYREKGQHPKTNHKVYLYGLREWLPNGPDPRNHGSVPQTAPANRVTIPLDEKTRENIELLVRSGKYPSATEAVLAAVGWGLEAKKKELAELKEWLDEIKRIPL